MSGSSTPTLNPNVTLTERDVSMNDTVIETSVIQQLMDRLKNLEENAQRTSQQLVESETKRAILQQQLKENIANISPLPTTTAIQQNAEPANVIQAVSQSTATVPSVSTHPNYLCYVPPAASGFSTMHAAVQSPTFTTAHITQQNYPPIHSPNYAYQPASSNFQDIHVPKPSISQTYPPMATQLNSQAIYMQPQLQSNLTYAPSYISQSAPRKLYELPEFSGLPEQWPKFVTAFQESSIAYGYTNLENNIRLDRCLKGAARQEVEGLMINPQNVLKVMEQLEFKFGQPEQLIRSQMEIVRGIKPISEQKLEELVPFASKVENLVTYLHNAAATQYLNDSMLLSDLTSKLPMTKRMEWASYSVVIKPHPTIEHFLNWIKPISRVVAKAAINVSPFPASRETVIQSSMRTKPMLVVKETPSRDNKIVCPLCTKPHFIAECSQFLNKTAEKRWECVKSMRLCFSCLLKGHNTFQCRRKRTCAINGCQRYHHPILHETPKTNNSSDVHQINAMLQQPLDPKSTKLLFKLLPVEIRGRNKRIVRTYAFLDEGSSTTLINESIADQLGIIQGKRPLSLQWFGGKATQISSMSLVLKIRGVVNNRKWQKMSAQSVPSLDLPMQTVNLTELQRRYHQLRNLPIAEYTDATPTVLIGLDNCHLTANLKSVKGDQSLVAAKTPLGWVIYGKSLDPRVRSTCQVSTILHIQEKDDRLEKVVADYFTTENFGVAIPRKPLESKDVIRARSIQEITTQKVGDRYETGLLWKSDDVVLPDSYKMAVNRLHSMETKMRKDPVFAEAYKSGVDDLLRKGFARRLSSKEAATKTSRTWYLPHFAVFNANKPGKLRLVFDAAAAVNGITLNSALLKGPDESQSLIKILFQFREKAIGVCADIKEMFLQVRIKKADQESQRFLWRDNDSTKPIQTYAMTSMIFGATCSPSCAQYVKNRNAIETASHMPDVVSAIVDNHYVDDFVCSFHDESEAIRVSSNVRNTHALAGFHLRGFVSNSFKVRSHLNEEELPTPEVNMNSSDAVEKVLGMFWDSLTDEFTFKLHLHRVDANIVNATKCPTKRQCLSLLMSVYDPFGMLANILIYGKVLLQDLWRRGIQWDEKIPEDIFQRFSKWVIQLQLVQEFRLRRCYSRCLWDLETNTELHIFVDASESVFAAIAYWRVSYKDETEICFIAGKTKCAPLKLMSVPRLELQAAVLGTRLRNAILECHNVKPKRTIFWSDSKTVICWIRSDHRQYKPFVAHRVGEILETSHESDWRWLPTRLNVADDATRATYPPEYRPNSRWICGPDFLNQPEEYWPPNVKIDNSSELQEERRRCCVVVHRDQVIDVRKFSNYLRLQRTVGWILRFVTRARQGKCVTEESNELTANELQRAETTLCKLVQLEMYQEEIAALIATNTVSKSSEIYMLTPRLNKDGVLVVAGRLDYALALMESTRQPAILPNRHPLTELIVQWYHQKFHHQNDELVVNEIRRKFWITHLRAAVKRAKSNCQHCKNSRALPKPPMMGQLPTDRVTPYVRPFTYTGLDYFGPFFVAIGRRREKRWAALFTCMTTRAIHIELAADLSTDACILCIRNFVNRRGVPVKIRSDMGTNFVGADREIQKVSDLFDDSQIQNELSAKGIKWIFNAPGNPSSGGCWERLIQSVKKVLAITLKERAPQVETLRSLLIEAENIVNSRPLTHLPVTIDDPDPLTPNHFLLGTTNSTQTPGEVTTYSSRKQYRISQQLKNTFWKRWVREYLPTITRRTKWFAPQKAVKEGDLVLIWDENLPRSQWKRGIVTHTIKAKDGHIRIADVKTSSGMLRRPVSRLAVLDVLGEVPQGLHGGRDVAESTISAK